MKRSAFRAIAVTAAAVLAAACSATDSAEAGSSENNISLADIDDYARSFLDNMSLAPNVRTAPVSSAFAYECADCDVRRGQPITKLVDGRMVNAVRAYSCETGTDHHYRPFFPGIQAFNDGLIPGLRTKIGGDKALANYYVKYGVRTVSESTFEVAASWSLLNYYNAATIHVDQPGWLFVSPPDANADIGIRSYARANHSSLRLNDGSEYRVGDQVEARSLGIWASTLKNEDFIAQNPEFLAAGQMADRDRRDFEYYRTVKDDPAWVNFMYRAAYEVAIALKCGTPVVAHSGGGTVALWVMRLLSVSELRDDLRAGKRGFGLVGLEAVLSKESKQLLLDELGVNSTQFIVGDQGSHTYSNVIAKEVVEIGSTPMDPIVVNADTNPPGWIGGGHGGLAFFTLQYGRVAGQPSFAHPQ
jgi:hypothetical protein